MSLLNRLFARIAAILFTMGTGLSLMALWPEPTAFDGEFSEGSDLQGNSAPPLVFKIINCSDPSHYQRNEEIHRKPGIPKDEKLHPCPAVGCASGHSRLSDLVSHITEKHSSDVTWHGKFLYYKNKSFFRAGTIYPCIQCKQRFIREAAFKRHKRQYHYDFSEPPKSLKKLMSKELKSFPCPVKGCPSGFKRKGDLFGHFDKQHIDEDQTLITRTFGEGGEVTYTYKDSVYTREGMYTYSFVCPSCKKAFSRNNAYKFHEKRCPAKKNLSAEQNPGVGPLEQTANIEMDCPKNAEPSETKATYDLTFILGPEGTL